MICAKNYDNILNSLNVQYCRLFFFQTRCRHINIDDNWMSVCGV